MNIQELREMNRREFAITIKKLNKNKMILILEAYGIWVSTYANVDSILNTLLDVVDDVIAPTNEDAEKIASKQKRRKSIASKKQNLIDAKEEYKQKFKALSLGEQYLILLNEFFEKHNDPFYLSAIMYPYNFIVEGNIETIDSTLISQELYNYMQELDWEKYSSNQVRLLYKYIHPDTALNYPMTAHIAKNFKMFNDLFKQQNHEDYLIA